MRKQKRMYVYFIYNNGIAKMSHRPANTKCMRIAPSLILRYFPFDKLPLQHRF